MKLHVRSSIVACVVITLAACDKPKDPAAAPAPGASAPAAFVLAVPVGLPPLAIPADNLMTEDKIELGKMLYFDKRLSKDGTVSCATCHDPKMAWAEKSATSEGIGKQKGGRNSPTVINAAYMTAQFWDGRAATLEEQALGPIQNPIEMGQSMTIVVEDLNRIPEYANLFKKVFGTGVTETGIAKAIAAFERTVLSGDSPYDRYQAGDKTALDEAQVRGLGHFNEYCAVCHVPPVFSNSLYYNAGVGSDIATPEEGRKAVTKNDADMGKFRVPHLRQIAETAPYFHDGSAATLEDAVALMAAGGKDNPNLSSPFKAIRDSNLTDANKADLVAFLKGLSGKFPVMDGLARP